MQVYWQNGSVTNSVGIKPVIAGLGFFDGVHLGHQAILLRVRELAKKMDGLPLMVTFDRHPLAVIKPDSVPLLLSGAKERRSYVWELGIKAICELVFDEQLSRLAAEEFVARILAQQLGVIGVVAGEDFRFGYRGQGGVELLKEMGPEWGIRFTDVVEPVSIKGERVSSTRIRALLMDGNVKEAARCLARPYRLRGPVVVGEGRGRDLGFPTANLDIPKDRLIPRDGVYAVTAHIVDGSSGNEGAAFADTAGMLGVLSIGDKPTFDGTERAIEVHVLDRQESYYGKELELSFHEWLRPSVRFSDAEELQAQIQRDIGSARRLFKTIPWANGGKIYSHRAL